MLVGGPGKRWAIDLTGRHPAAYGYKYMMTAVCCFSKFGVCVPIRNKEASTVAKSTVDHVFLQWGMCHEILTDLGKSSQQSCLMNCCSSSDRNYREFVCSSTMRFQRLNYGAKSRSKCSSEFTSVRLLEGKSPMCKKMQFVNPKTIIILKAGRQPRQSTKMTLNRSVAKYSFKKIVHDIAVVLHFENPITCIYGQ